MSKLSKKLVIKGLLDRVQLTAEPPVKQRPPELKGFRVFCDHWVRPQTNIPTYARSREYRSTKSTAKVFWQYQPRCPWLQTWKVTLIADDRFGLSPREVWEIIRHCRSYRLLIVEIALDFSTPPSVNERFVRRHGIFGKSRRRG